MSRQNISAVLCYFLFEFFYILRRWRKLVYIDQDTSFYRICCELLSTQPCIRLYLPGFKFPVVFLSISRGYWGTPCCFIIYNNIKSILITQIISIMLELLYKKVILVL